MTVLPKLSPSKKNQVGFSSLIIIIIILIVVLIGISTFAFLKFSSKETVQPSATPKATTQKTELSAPIKEILDKKLVSLEELTQNSNLINNLELSSVKNSKLSKQEITKLDDTWKSSMGVTEVMKPYLENETAQILIDFQNAHPEFVEIFATDKVGLNVGQTNKTSDYYQADEDWWIEGYNNGTGKAFYGEIEYDESAKSESIALYQPIFNSKKEVVGVIKAVLSISALQREL